VDVHDRIDRSDETGIERARAALGLNDTALGLIRADVLAWIRAASNERAE
jgi:hypothetical protein